MKYLKIENPGVCQAESFTILGAGLSDTNLTPEQSKLIIGQFHSGCKNATALLLRKKLTPQIFLSGLKMEFRTVEEYIKDEVATKRIERIYVDFSGKDDQGNKKAGEKLSFTTEFGDIVWDRTELALREFVSNAIDFCIRKYNNWDDVKVEVVEESEVRAKAGYTRIYIPFTKEVEKFYWNLNKWFLHFEESNFVTQEILPKKNRGIEDENAAVIYRRGVYVRECKTNNASESMFDYNLTDLEIDEARKATEWNARYASAQALGRCTDKSLLCKYFYNLDKEHLWEFELEPSYMYGLEQNKEIWQDAFKTVCLDKVVCTIKEKDKVERKGYEPLVVSDIVFRIMMKIGVKTYMDVLSSNEVKDIAVFPADQTMIDTVNASWKFLERNNLSRNFEKPEVFAFSKLVEAGVKQFGFYDDDKVFLSQDLGGDLMFKTVIEELGHHVTKAPDGSSDMQNFYLDVISALNKECSL